MGTRRCPRSLCSSSCFEASRELRGLKELESAARRRVPVGIPRGDAWALGALVLVLAAGRAMASQGSHAAGPNSAVQQARAQREAGGVRGAIERLKEAVEHDPGNEALTIALAQAYLADKNAVWATRVLNQYMEDYPRACHARFLLAWVQIGEGLPEIARDTVASAECSAPPEVNARRLLVLAYLAHVEGDPERVRRLLRQVRQSRALYAEDRRVLEQLSAEYEPGRQPVASGNAELALGYTSNGLAGSPVDLASPDSPGSPVSVFQAGLRVTLPAAGSIRAVLDGKLRTQRLWEEQVEELSFRHGQARAGLLVGARSPVLVAFSEDVTQLRGGDLYDAGPIWFAEAQRAEVEVELGSLLSVTGAGWRRFREQVRSRFEVDHTIGWGVVGWRGIRTVAGASLRYHDADLEAYDLVGATVMGQVRVPVYAGSAVTATVTTSADAYPRSRAYFAGAGESARRDGQLRVRAGAWSPPLAGARLGATYEWTTRNSSATAYDYVDHRVLGQLEWQFDTDTLGRRRLENGDQPRFEYDTLGPGDQGSTAEIRDLMRRDESVSQGSSCAR